MYVEKDYILRLIHEVIRMLFRLLCGIDIDKTEETEVPAAAKERYLKWISMIDDGRINEAENLLSDGLNPDDSDDLKLALFFYRHLNEKSDEFLNAHNFSREEILEGVKYVVSLYGYGGMLEAFLEDF